MRTPKRSLGSGFGGLFNGSLITNTGDGIRLAALPLLAADLTSSPLLISAVTAAQYLPWATFAPLGGALVDRWDRRRTILVMQAWRGVVLIALSALVLLDLVAIWQLCLVAFLVTVGEILVDPSIVALVPALVEDEDLDSANGRIAAAEIVTNDFAGGPVGAALFGLAPWLPFVVDGTSYLASLLPFRRVPPRTLRAGPHSDDPVPVRSVLTEAKEGFVWLWHHPLLGPFTAAQVLYYFGFSSGLSLLVVLVTIEADAPPLAFGGVLAAGAVGAVIGSLLGSRIAGVIGRRATLAGAVLLQGLALLAMAAADSVPQFLVLWFLGGVPSGVQRPVARAMQQRLTPNHLLGRVNVTARIFTRGVIIVGALAGGALATVVGVRWSFVGGGTTACLAGVAVWLALGRDVPRTDGGRAAAG